MYPKQDLECYGLLFTSNYNLIETKEKKNYYKNIYDYKNNHTFIL